MPDSTELAALSRRRFLTGTVAAAGGAAVLAVAGSRAARATNLYNLQGNWGWCSLCSQAYYAGSSFRGQGDCPKQPGNGHATPGWNYAMVYNQATTPGLPGTPGYQDWWSWCQYCQSPFWPDWNAAGQCVAGRGDGSHDPGASWAYAMPVGINSPSYQGGWNVCKACSTYYHSNGGSGTDAGFCWVNSNRFGGSNAHTHGSSWQYKLIH